MVTETLDSGDYGHIFGIVAVSFGYLNRSQLESWLRKAAAAQGTPLGEMLLQEKVLTADEYTQIRRLVDQYVGHCGKNPRARLESSADPASLLLEVLRPVDDTDVQRSLTRIVSATIASEATPDALESRHDLEDTHESLAAGVSFIDQFPLQDLLGEGSFGIVWKATDPRLDRPVAIKVAKPEQSLRVDRFAREAKAAAQLRHPHIVPVYACGDHGDAKYIVYEFVEGTTLKSLLKARGRYSSHDAAVLVAKLASALHYAHERGIVHRDIKPDNVLIDKHDEPHITDFGLAKQLFGGVQDALLPSSGDSRDPQGEEPPSLLREVFGSGAVGSDEEMTKHGSVLGTPSYMSPEQAEGLPVDGRSDLWSVGVMFGELLTTKRPFYGNTAELLHQVCCREPARLRKIQPDVPADLEAIWLNCLQKDPNQRFKTGQELADELNRWLRGEPVHSRPISVAARTARWAKRNPAVASLLSAVCFALAAGALLAFIAYGSRVALRNAQINEILTAVPAEFPDHLDSIESSGSSQALITELEQQRHLRARVALLCFRVDPNPAEMVDALLLAPSAEEFLSYLEAFESRHATVIDALGELVRSDDQAGKDRFRAACGLALFGREQLAAGWDNSVITVVAGRLLRESREERLVWTPAIRRLKDRLEPQLTAAYDEGNSVAAELLAELWAGDTESLLDAIETATPSQIAPLVAKLPRQPATAERLGERRRASELPVATANFAVAEWTIGEYDAIRELLEPGEDNSIRTLIVHRIAAADPSPRRVIEWLAGGSEADGSVLAALWLALGEYDQYSLTELSSQEQRRLRQLVVDGYLNARSGAVHSAVEWLMRRWGLRRPEVRYPLTAEASDRQWFSIADHELVILRRPLARRVLRSSSVTIIGEPTRLDYSFAIATKEVTIEQFLKFLGEADSPAALLQDNHGPQLAALQSQDPGLPIYQVSWPLALQYCDWLTRSHFEQAAQLAENPSLHVTDYGGVRLPTPMEWDCACFAGGSVERFFGKHVGEEVEREYAQLNAAPVIAGWLKPNSWGLFDTRGNVRELCLDGDQPRPITRGGSYRDLDYVGNVGPRRPTADVGFRIAITLK